MQDTGDSWCGGAVKIIASIEGPTVIRKIRAHLDDHAILAATARLKKVGYGAGYEYDHDPAEGFSGKDYFPDDMPRVQFNDPPERGFEREIRKRLEYWSKLCRKRD